MKTGELKLTFWCLRHSEVCYTTREALRVVCEQGNEVLSDDFRRDPWHFCSGCQTFFARADNQTANKSCPACGQAAARRYLCQHCGVFSFEAAGRSTTREFAFGVTGTPTVCPGCLRPPQGQLHEHDCQAFGATFTTARAKCPFCATELAEALKTNYEFPPTFRKLVNDYLQTMSQNPNAFRAELVAPEAMTAVAHGRFWLTPFRDETLIAFPDIPQFASWQDHQNWQTVFDCQQPGVGEVVLVKPAVVKFNGYTGQYQLTQRGELAVQAKETVPLVTAPMPNVTMPETPPPSAPLPSRMPGSVPQPAAVNPSAPLPEPTSPRSISRPPMPLLVVGCIAGVFLIGTMGYLLFNSAKRTIISKVKAGQTVTPAGDSAYDIFMKGGLSESDLAELRKEVAPLLQTQGESVVRQLVNDGYNPPANELNDAAKLYGWLNQLTPSNAYQSREHYFKGRSAYEGKDWSGAENEFNQARRLDNTWALPVNTLARVFMRRKDFQTARNCYEEAIRIDPNWIFPRINLCVLLNENIKDYVAGEQACRDTLQLDGNKASAHYYLGRALEGQGKKCDAYQAYLLAIQNATNNTNPGFNVERLNNAIAKMRSQCWVQED